MPLERETVTVFQFLGRDLDPAEPVEAIDALDRALVFIGGGISALGTGPAP